MIAIASAGTSTKTSSGRVPERTLASGKPVTWRRIAVDHDLAVDPRDRAGQAARPEHQRGFERQDAPQAPGLGARETQPGQPRASLPQARCRAPRPSRRSRRAVAASRSPRSWPSPSLVNASMLASRAAAVATSRPMSFRPLLPSPGHPRARAIAPRASRRVRPGTQIDAERRGRHRRPEAAVVGGADEDHARWPGEVGRECGDPEANIAAWGGQRERAADTDVVIFCDLLGDRDPAACVCRRSRCARRVAVAGHSLRGSRFRAPPGLRQAGGR